MLRNTASCLRFRSVMYVCVHSLTAFRALLVLLASSRVDGRGIRQRVIFNTPGRGQSDPRHGQSGLHIMDEFSYAHRDTSYAGGLNKPNIPEELQRIREEAFASEIPVAADDTLCFLMAQAAAVRPESILELGTAVGTTSIAMAFACPQARITTVERDRAFYEAALVNFGKCGISGRVTAVCGDAGEVIERLEDPFDLIFMDCAKVQYIKYLPRLKQLLRNGGVLIADDVLLYGWASGEAEVPKKRKMLARHIREYIDAVTSDPELFTCIIKAGDGVALSVKR